MIAEDVRHYIQLNTESEKESLEIANKTLQEIKDQVRAARDYEEYREFMERVQGVEP